MRSRAACLLAAAFCFAGCSSSKKEKNIIAAPTLPEETILDNAINTYDEGLYRVSLQNWTDLRDGYPTSYYSTLAELKLADTQYFIGEYPAALVAYEEFAKLHPGHEAMPYVRYQIGNCHLKQYRDIKRDQAPLQAAIVAFQQLIDSNPRSEYVVLGRRRLQHCRELQAAYEQYVAGFYERRGFEDAAASRMKHLSQTFPDSQALARSDMKPPAEAASEMTEAKVPAADSVPAPSSPAAPASPPAGKAPATPKVFAHSGLESPDYGSALGALKSAHPDIREENLTGSSAAAMKDEKETPAPVPGAVESFECEETEDGALFTITLRQDVVVAPEQPEAEKKSDELSFAFTKPSMGAAQEDRCAAGGAGIDLRADAHGLRLHGPSGSLERASAIVLNRPERIVLSIPK